MDQIKAGYINLLNYLPLLKNTVNTIVLSPLVFISKFYLPPFHLKLEKKATADIWGRDVRNQLVVDVFSDKGREFIKFIIYSQQECEFYQLKINIYCMIK